MARKLAAVMFLLGGLHAPSGLALGLGELQLQSFLNEPLSASVELLDMGGLHSDEVIVRLASRDDFDRFGLDRPYFLSSITFDVSVQENGAASIILSSAEPVLEPYLEFIIEARWPSGQLLREYTLLMDPPPFSEVEAVVVSALQRVDETETIPAVTRQSNQVISSGTSLEIRSSDLDPGAMPQRDYNAATVLSPVPGSRYMITQEDTLWRIASLAKPRGASIQQTMLDIQRLNSDAFIKGNINAVKAGYILDLPGESDISSVDANSALAAVREQNAAWREGRDVMPKAKGGPLLTISTDAKADATSATVGINATSLQSEAPRAALPSVSVATAIPSDTQESPSLADEMQQRLLDTERQLETLQRIISLKDDQIAALQSALVAAGAVVETKSEPLADSSDDILLEAETVSIATPGTDVAAPREAVKENVEEVASSIIASPTIASVDAVKAVPAIAPDTDVSDGWLKSLFYMLGVVILGVIAFVVVRRRNAEGQAIAHAAELRSDKDMYLDSPLKDQGLDDEESANNDVVIAEDAHASDGEAANVLADVDIYLLYGREVQAIDLLNNAIASDPGNALYKLKLLEIEAPDDDSSPTNPELQIEGQTMPSDGTDDLNLPIDFSSPGAAGLDNEELVIAADGYGLSTKLDLARAYIDMGDDEAARQMLLEVIVEGTDELKLEAGVLLKRIGE